MVPSDPADRLRMVFLYLRGTAGVYYWFGEGSGGGSIANHVFVPRRRRSGPKRGWPRSRSKSGSRAIQARLYAEAPGIVRSSRSIVRSTSPRVA